jgi:hypothetical protein
MSATLTLWEEHKLRVSENRVLREIFGAKGEQVTGGWNKVHEEPHNLYSSPNIMMMIKSRKMGQALHIVRTYMGDKECVHNLRWKA